MSSSSSSSSGWSAFPSTCRLRRLSRLLCLVLFAAVGMSFAYRSLCAEAEFAAAVYTSKNADEVLAHHTKARLFAPWNHGIRAGAAYFFTSYRRYDDRYRAIATLEQELKFNPFAADLWMALAAYKLASQDPEGAEKAVEHVQKLRRNAVLVKG